MKRFKHSDPFYSDMEEHEDGAWVKWNDVKHLIAKPKPRIITASPNHSFIQYYGCSNRCNWLSTKQNARCECGGTFDVTVTDV